jgi:hypothetical protein
MGNGWKRWMNNLLKNKLFIACILVGLLAALYVNYQRHQVESASHTVELVMDYEEIVDLAASEGAEVAGLMRQFRDAGIVSLAVYDMTLEKLSKSGKIFTLSGAELLQRSQTGVPADPAIAELLKAGRITADRVYVFGPATLTFQEVQEDLIRRLGAERVISLHQGTTHVLEVKGNYEKLVKWNLGLSTVEMAAVVQYGFYVAPRPTNYERVTTEDVDAVFARIEKQDKTSAIFFVGEEVLGYKAQLERTAYYLNKGNIVLGLIEHPLQLQFLKQEGLVQLAQKINYRAARVYVIPKEEQPKLKIQEAVERWILSDRERNIRINLMRMYTKPEGDKTLTQTNLTYVEKTKRGLEAAGFSVGRAGTFNAYYPPRAALACIILAACTAGVMLLAELVALSNILRWSLLLGTFLPLAAVVLLGHGNLARQAGALGSAIIFPSLAMGWQIEKWSHVKPGQYDLGQILWNGIKGVAQVSLFSAIGGLFIAALLGDVRYLLEIEIYRGVKLTFVAPLLIVTYLFFRHVNIGEGASGKPEGVLNQIQRLLDQPVLFKYLGGLALAALVAIIYVGRSGHTAGIPVPAFEVKIRAIFEQIFYARPRTREFLIGHPTFMMATYAVYRGWPKIWYLVLVVFASMGQSSLVETFAHLRTPVVMSLVRGIDGWVVGVILGIVAVVILHLVLKVAVHLGRRTVGHG